MQNPVECIILKNGKPATYDTVKKILFVAAKGFTVFPSKHQARSAQHHSVEADKLAGIENPHLQYVIEET